MSTFLLLTVFAMSMTFTPGPANLTLFGNSIRWGVRATLPLAVGVSIGFQIVALAVVLGLAELFVHYPSLHTGVQVLGTGYILYLSWGLWQARLGVTLAGKDNQLGLVQGILVHPLSPKAWTMVIAAYAQFVSPGDNWVQGGILMSVFFITGVMANMSWVFAGNALAGWLQKPRVTYGVFSFLSILMIAMAGLLWTI